MSGITSIASVACSSALPAAAAAVMTFLFLLDLAGMIQYFAPEIRNVNREQNEPSNSEMKKAMEAEHNVRYPRRKIPASDKIIIICLRQSDYVPR